MIIHHDLVGQFGFGVYGGAGKALIFAAIAFGLLAYRARRHLDIPAWHWTTGLWVLPAIVTYTTAWFAITHLQQGEGGFWWPFLTHIGIVATIAFIALATLGWRAMRVLYQTYKRELLLALAIGISFYIFLTIVYALWKVFALVVMHAVRWLLQLSGLEVYIIPPRALLLDNLSVDISQWCSGIESIALFTGFYVMVGLVDRNKLNFRKYAAIFLPALVAIFCLNILRVYVLIMAGYYIDPHIAFTLFHTYAGMIFFIIFSAIFWKLFYKWMLKKPVDTGVRDSIG